MRGTSENILLNKMRSDEQKSKIENTFFMLAHDIKSPIKQVKGLLEIAQNLCKDNTELEKILNMAVESNQKLGNKVDQILSISLDAQTESTHEIDFNQLFERVKDSLTAVEGYEHTKFIIRVDEDLNFFGNAVQLQSILQNLVENAIKYRKVGSSKNIIIFGIHKIGDLLVIKISDNGRGINKRKLPRIFEKSYKASESDNGHGVGLHLVKKNLNSMGGDIMVESEEGEGTTFTIELPYKSKLQVVK